MATLILKRRKLRKGSLLQQCNSGRLLIAGTPLEPVLPTGRGNASRGQSNPLDKVKTCRIGKSAAKPLSQNDMGYAQRPTAYYGVGNKCSRNGDHPETGEDMVCSAVKAAAVHQRTVRDSRPCANIKLNFQCRLFTWWGLVNRNPMANGVGIRF